MPWLRYSTFQSKTPHLRDYAWFNYHDEAREQIDLAVVMKTVESVCSTLGCMHVLTRHGEII